MRMSSPIIARVQRTRGVKLLALGEILLRCFIWPYEIDDSSYASLLGLLPPLGRIAVCPAWNAFRNGSHAELPAALR